VDIYEAHIVGAGELHAKRVEGPGVFAGATGANPLRTRDATLKAFAEFIAISDAGSVVARESVLALTAGSITAVGAACQVRAIGRADVLADSIGAKWRVFRALAAASTTAIVAALQIFAIRFARLFFANTLFTEVTILALAAIAFVSGTSRSAFDVVANKIAFDGAGTSLAQSIWTVTATPAAAVVAALQIGAIGDALDAAASFADMADAAVATASAATIRPADRAVAEGNAFTLARDGAIFAATAFATNAPTAIITAFFAEA